MLTIANPSLRADSLQRLSALDGLRALAVAAVIGYHLAPAEVPGGKIGVDIFFVISGFVITRLLLIEQRNNGRISLRNFYVRRVLRLVPALFVMVAVVAGIVAITGLHADEQRLSWFALTYTMDFYRAWLPVDGNGGSVLLGHTWSLGVEEQFYLVWPLALVCLIAGKVKARTLAIVLVVLIAASIGERYWLISINPGNTNRVYNSPDTRADQLLAGCLLAVIWLSPELSRVALWLRRAANLLAWPAVAVLVTWALQWEYALNGPTTIAMLPKNMALATLLAFVIVSALVSAPRSRLSRLLSNPVLVSLGTISYGIYLWQNPIIRLLDGRLTEFWSINVALELSVIMSAALVSWYVVERPFLKLKRHFQSDKQIVPPIIDLRDEYEDDGDDDFIDLTPETPAEFEQALRTARLR